MNPNTPIDEDGFLQAFRERAEQMEIAPPRHAWQRLEQRLDSRRHRRRLVATRVGTAAAVLLALLMATSTLVIIEKLKKTENQPIAANEPSQNPEKPSEDDQKILEFQQKTEHQKEVALNEKQQPVAVAPTADQPTPPNSQLPSAVVPAPTPAPSVAENDNEIANAPSDAQTMPSEATTVKEDVEPTDDDEFANKPTTDLSAESVRKATTPHKPQTAVTPQHAKPLFEKEAATNADRPNPANNPLQWLSGSWIHPQAIEQWQSTDAQTMEGSIRDATTNREICHFRATFGSTPHQLFLQIPELGTSLTYILHAAKPTKTVFRQNSSSIDFVDEISFQYLSPSQYEIEFSDKNLKKLVSNYPNFFNWWQIKSDKKAIRILNR